MSTIELQPIIDFGSMDARPVVVCAVDDWPSERAVGDWQRPFIFTFLATLTSSERLLRSREASDVPRVELPGRAPILAAGSIHYPEPHLHARAVTRHARIQWARPKYGSLLYACYCDLLRIGNTFGSKRPCQTSPVALRRCTANSLGDEDCSRRLHQRENHAQALLKSSLASQPA